MNTYKLFLVLLMAGLLFHCSPKTMGGLSKEEYNAWKQKKKELTPENYKALLEQNDSLSEENEHLSEKESYLNQVIERKDNEINRLTSQISKIKEEGPKLNSVSNAPDPWDKGVVFRVQLAAFDDFDLRELTENGSDLKIIDQDGYIKYVLGQFRDYEMADKFKKKLRKIGVNEAWIVPYRDGKRVPLKEVLTEVID
ncbi:SPOR domain-containing protein [Cyclobacterium jeungdonense]|uniref:SPOR domain-containing protein n=1 Tax=Cyclobacterium jeungdonense TaxID=708087 RepID=A0ABT8C7J8_9BACT|nr:SPOR domain-containing protein [Cyclobacterium jeungdonense]MDN3688034.1 SPOR domain-containing protein [Cyclobacterium jeungdonense]